MKGSGELLFFPMAGETEARPRHTSDYQVKPPRQPALPPACLFWPAFNSCRPSLPDL